MELMLSQAQHKKQGQHLYLALPPPKNHDIASPCSSKPWDAGKKLLLQDGALALQLCSFRGLLPLLLLGAAICFQPL